MENIWFVLSGEEWCCWNIVPLGSWNFHKFLHFAYETYYTCLDCVTTKLVIVMLHVSSLSQIDHVLLLVTKLIFKFVSDYIQQALSCYSEKLSCDNTCSFYEGCNIISEQKGHIIHTWSRRACNIILSQKKHVLSYLAKKKHVPFSIKRGMYHHALQKEKHVPSYLVQNECMHHNYPKYVPCFCAFWESDWKGYLKPSGMKFFEMVNIQVPCQVSALHVC